MGQTTNFIPRPRYISLILILTLIQDILGAIFDGGSFDASILLVFGTASQRLQPSYGIIGFLLAIGEGSEGGQWVNNESCEWLLPHFLNYNMPIEVLQGRSCYLTT